MITPAEARTLALSFPGTIEQPHFERAAFKVMNKRIFATLHKEDQTVNMKLSVSEQKVFSSYSKKSIYPVPNKFGQQGWTTFDLKHLEKDVFVEALTSAYKDALGSKRSKK